MPEIPVRIKSTAGLLEGQYDAGCAGGTEGVILCHPHPAYGGSMDNNVVFALRSALSRHGWATLRFNFRGVGESEGEYSEGEGEPDDVLAARAFLEEKGKSDVIVAGYSFGAWIALKAVARGLEPRSLILVSPPMDFLDFKGLTLPPVPTLLTLGDRDSFCAFEVLRRWLQEQPLASQADLVEVPSCDHFYWNCEDFLSARVMEFVLKYHKPGA